MRETPDITIPTATTAVAIARSFLALRFLALALCSLTDIGSPQILSRDQQPGAGKVPAGTECPRTTLNKP
jgi:hypothetical protein